MISRRKEDSQGEKWIFQEKIVTILMDWNIDCLFSLVVKTKAVSSHILTWTVWVQFQPSPTHNMCLLCSAMSGLMKLACLDWNIASCQSRIPESDLPHLYQKAIDLLNLLQRNLPDKTGKISKSNFEKEPSILYKVCKTRPMGKLRQHFVSIP